MRSNSLVGTRPASTNLSVPRLMALYKRPDPNLAWPGFGQRLVADFGASGADIPKRFGAFPLDRALF